MAARQPHSNEDWAIAITNRPNLAHGEIPFSSSAVNRVLLTVFAQC